MGVSTSLFGLWGLILIIFGVLAYAVAPGASAYVLLHLGLGFLLLILYFASSRGSLFTGLSERSTKYGASAAVYSLAVVAVLGVGNWLGVRHNVRWDLTAQNVFSLSNDAAFKLTMQYYRLPGGRKIHRTDNSTQWGIDPDVHVEMLPSQIGDSLQLRQEADIVDFDQDGKLAADFEPVDVGPLLTEGIDPQLETAVLLMKSQLIGKEAMGARATLN